MALVGLNEVLEYLGLASGVADTLIQTLMDDASGRVNSFCGRNFELKSYYEKIDVEGPTEASIKLENVPIVSVVALTDNGSLVDSDDYHVYRQGRVTLDSDYFTEGYQKVEVLYKAGFTAIPDDIQNATKKLIAEEYGTRKRRGFLSEKIGDYAYRMPDMSRSAGFPTDVEQTLRQYKIITGA